MTQEPVGGECITGEGLSTVPGTECDPDEPVLTRWVSTDEPPESGAAVFDGVCDDCGAAAPVRHAAQRGDNYCYGCWNPMGVEAMSDTDRIARQVVAGMPDGSRLWLGGTTAGAVHLDSLVVPPRFRRQGYADRAVRELCAWADQHGVTLTVTPEPVTSQRHRVSGEGLRRLYRRHGFVPNSGRRARHELSGAMYRDPQQGE